MSDLKKKVPGYFLSRIKFAYANLALMLRIKFAYANLALNRIASGEVNSPIRDEILI